jgi:hypothetical protein
VIRFKKFEYPVEENNALNNFAELNNGNEVGSGTLPIRRIFALLYYRSTSANIDA